MTILNANEIPKRIIYCTSQEEFLQYFGQPRELTEADIEAARDAIMPKTPDVYCVRVEDSMDEPESIKDYESLAKRLLGAMHYGIRIESSAGHRYIIFDLDADNCPNVWKQKWQEEYEYQEKFYGSVIGALDYVDSLLSEVGKSSTYDAYSYYIRENIDGEGTNCEQKVFGLDPTV